MLEIKLKLKKTYKKLIHYFSIFTIILGTTFGSINSAIAANGDPVGIADGGTANASTTNIDQSDLTLQTLEGSTTAFTLTGDINVDTITFEDFVNVDLAIAVASDITVDETIIMPDQTTGSVYTFTVADSKTMTVGGSITEGANATLNIVLANGTLTLNGSSAQTIDAAIDSDSGNDGDIIVSNTAGVTFSDAIGGGGTDELGSITVSSGASATFNGAVHSLLVTNSGTLAINNTIDGAALSSIVMNTSDLVLNFNSASTRDLDMVVTATADGYGTINIIDTSGSAAAAAQVTSGGDIGTTGNRIGTINVGSSTANGALTTIDDDAIFADNFNIIGGDHVDEDSIAILAENISVTNGIVLTAANLGDAELNTAGAAVVITGTVDSGSGTDGAGETRIDADIQTTFANNVGATTAIEKMEVAAVQVDLDGATNVIESVVITGAGTLEFGAASDQTMTGAITVAADDDGTIINANTAGELTFSAALGAEDKRLTEVTLNDDLITNFNGAIFTKILDIDVGTTNNIVLEAAGSKIGSDALAVGSQVGALEIEAGTTIELGTAFVSGDVVFDTGEVEDGGGAGDDDTGVVITGTITIKPSANFTSGTIKFIDGDADNMEFSTEQGYFTVQDTALTDFSVSTTKQDVTITATAKSDTTTASELSVTTNNAKSLRQAIESANTGSSSDSAALTALNDSLVVINGRSATDDTDLAKQVAPQDDMISGSTLASKAVTGTVQGIISNRMASLRSGDAYYGMGMSAGNMTAKSGFIQAFGSEVEQKNKTVGSGTQYGYDSSSAGFALGFDGTTDTGATVGLSFSMSNTDLDGKGTGKAKNDIDSYTASLYWDKTGQNGYVEGSLTYGLNENKTSRLVNTAGLSRTYTGSYDSNQVSLSLGGGAPNAVGASGYVTPFIGITGTYIKTDAYTESSTTAGDSLRLRVAQDDVNSLVGKVGVKYHNVTDKGTPMISLSLNNEFGDDTINSTNTYQGGGSSFTTSTDVEPLSATLGLGYSYGSDTASIEFAYEAEANDDKYLGHYGSIKIVGKF